ncbi:hypothetical protein ACLBO7_31075, partial [Klebsiella pneumoniae]
DIAAKNLVLIELRVELFVTGVNRGDYITIVRGGDAQKKLDDVFNYVMTNKDIEGFKTEMWMILVFVQQT